MLKTYAVFVLVFGIFFQSVAVLGTWVTLTLIPELGSAESYKLDFWVSLVLFWVIGIVGIASAIGMLRNHMSALHRWKVFSWIVLGITILWAILDASYSEFGIDNFFEVLFFGVSAVLATVVWRQESNHAAT